MKFKSVISSVAMALFWHFYFAYKFFSAWWVPYNSETIKFRDVLHGCRRCASENWKWNLPLPEREHVLLSWICVRNSVKRPFQCRNLLSSTVAWFNLLVCLLKNLWIVFFSFDYCNCRDYLGCLADGGREDLWHPGYVRRRKVKSLMQKPKGLFTQRSGIPALINLACKQALTPPPKLSEIFKTCSAFYVTHQNTSQRCQIVQIKP